MSKARLLATEKLVANLSPEELQRVLKSRGVTLSETPFGSAPGEELLYVKTPVSWKGDASKMPQGAKDGLGIAIGMSQACAGVRGIAVDPKTGYEVPKKVLCQRAIEYTRKARKATRKAGSVPAESIGLTIKEFSKPSGY